MAETFHPRHPAPAAHPRTRSRASTGTVIAFVGRALKGPISQPVTISELRRLPGLR
ncbi:MAG: hypothetical protein U1F11_04940 [Steroidobacteraceae bacterium]